MALDAVLFDNDGTLVDTHDLLLESFRHATRTVLGTVLPDDQLMAKVGQPLSTQMWDFTSDPETHDELLRVYRERNERLHDDAISLFPGTVEALERMADAGLRLGVVTSKMHPLCAHGLDVLGIAPYFEVLIGANDCDKHKPDPAPVVLACENMGIKPDRVAYVGDSPFDMQAGNGAGCVTAAVLWGMFSEERLRAENPAMVSPAFANLADRLIAMR